MYMANVQSAPNIVQNNNINATLKPVSSVANVSLPRKKKGKEAIYVAILIVVVVVTVVSLLHFNIIESPISAKNISSSSNINAFSSATTPQSVMQIINSHITSNAAFNVGYNGNMGVSLGSATINIPTNLSFAKNGNLFRVSFDINFSSVADFISSIFNISIVNSTQRSELTQTIAPLSSGVLIYNGTGIVICNVKNSSFSNCSYEQLSLPEQDVLYSMLGSINSSTSNSSITSGESGNYSNLLAEIDTSTNPVFTYKGVSSYAGQQCSLDDIGPVTVGNYSYVGSVCFSDSLGLPLNLRLRASPTSVPKGNFSLFSNIGFSLDFSANVSKTAPSPSFITALPSGAVFHNK